MEHGVSHLGAQAAAREGVADDFVHERLHRAPEELCLSRVDHPVPPAARLHAWQRAEIEGCGQAVRVECVVERAALVVELLTRCDGLRDAAEVVAQVVADLRTSGQSVTRAQCSGRGLLLGWSAPHQQIDGQGCGLPGVSQRGGREDDVAWLQTMRAGLCKRCHHRLHAGRRRLSPLVVPCARPGLRDELRQRGADKNRHSTVLNMRSLCRSTSIIFFLFSKSRTRLGDVSRVWHSDGERRAEIAHAPSGRRSCLSSQSVTTTLLAGSSWITHILLFFSFECGDNLCIFVFLYFSLVFKPTGHTDTPYVTTAWNLQTRRVLERDGTTTTNMRSRGI